MSVALPGMGWKALHGNLESAKEHMAKLAEIHSQRQAANFMLGKFGNPHLIQLDWPPIADWAYSGIFCYRGPISNPRRVLDSLAQTTRGMLLDFFVKHQNRLLCVFC